MKKILLSALVAAIFAIPSYAYDAASRVTAIGPDLMTKNGIVATNVKFKVVDGVADNSEYSTNKTVNISKEELVYTGNDNEVAAVVANQLGHIISGHASKGKVLSIFTSGITTDETVAAIASSYKYTKEQKEADVLSINLMANAGYNPLASIVVLTKQTGTAWEAIMGKPANAERAMNIYDYVNYAYPAKAKAGYGCNEYKNFLVYANSVLDTRANNAKLKAKADKEMAKYRKTSVSQIKKFKTRGGISGWDAAYNLLTE